MSDPQIFSRQRKIKKALSLMNAYKAVFLTPAGQTVLVDLAVKCKMTAPVTDVSGGAVSAFYDGKRAAFLDIMKMTACDERRLIDLLQQAERTIDE